MQTNKTGFKGIKTYKTKADEVFYYYKLSATINGNLTEFKGGMHFTAAEAWMERYSKMQLLEIAGSNMAEVLECLPKAMSEIYGIDI